MSKLLSYYFIILILAVLGCQKSSFENKRKADLTQREKVYRKRDECFCVLDHPDFRAAPIYPWDTEIRGHPRLTKEFFRCKGEGGRVPRTEEKRGEKVSYTDCEGGSSHSLPLKGEEEFIYPILIDLLNYIQEKLGKRVIITSGHRCPKHHLYIDSSSFHQNSKHMIGAEVDFYVEGLFFQPQEVIKLVMNFYKEKEFYKNSREHTEFLRYDKGDSDVAVMPWYNKEIFIKLYGKHEGRNLDNTHAFPYISIQVRYDRDLKQRVNFDWQKAYKGYLQSS